MAECTSRFCSLCDPSSIPAIQYCTDCDEFLCIECVKPHQTSKRLKTHSRLSVENYEKLPSFVRELQLTCQEHEEKLDSFCPVHSIPCCLRCVLTKHKTCEGVKPVKDLLSNSKDSSIIVDFEQTVSDVCRFVVKLIADRYEKKNMIAIQKEKIIEEIKAVKSAALSQLDALEKNLYEILDLKSNEIRHDIDVFIGQLQKISESLTEMKAECGLIINHASDLQTFLSLPALMSSVGEKETEVQKISEDERPSKMNLSFQADKCFTNVASIGLIKTTTEERKVQYIKSKEKQAQILEPVTVKTVRNISQIKSFALDLNHSDNIISGCDVSKDDKIIIAEYNIKSDCDLTERVSVHDTNGSFLKSLTKRRVGYLFDVTVIDEDRIAFTSYLSYSLLCILKITDSIFLKEMKTSDNIALCGIALGDNDYIYVMEHTRGIHRYNLKTRGTSKDIVVDGNVGSFSYVAYHDGKLVYTLGEEHNVVKCCDAESGMPLWTFENTELLCDPRALVVDKDGVIYVVGHTSNNVVML